MQYLMALGEHRGSKMEFEEVGFGDVLTRIDQTIKRQTDRAALEPYLQELRLGGAATTPTPAPTRANTARDKVSKWNGKHPVGTRVKSALNGGGELVTRTEALVLFGHRAAVYMKGYNGYFDLDEVVPV